MASLSLKVQRVIEMLTKLPEMSSKKSKWMRVCVTIAIALLIAPLIGFGSTQNVTELNDTPPENITDITAPIITIQSPINTTYNATGIDLNYTIDEPAEWVRFSLNGADNVTIFRGNITFNASVGLNDLVIYASDTADNSGKAEVQFTVVNINIATENITDVTTPDVTELSDITLKLITKKDFFALDAEPAFTFEYNPFIKSVDGKELEEVAASGGSKKAFKKWMTADETIETFVYDGSGNLTDIEAEIEKIQEGTFEIKLLKERAFRAGVYKLEVELVQDERVYVVEKEFPWGLVSLNTRKSIYKPGETAEFIIVVLDKDGHAVCNADISMTVTNPDDVETTYSTEERTILPGKECGLYNASYLTEVGGNHTISVTALIGGVEVDFSTHFLVKQDYAFEIIRTAQSKIDPTRRDRFDVRIDIESFGDANSIIVKEFVPAEFEISTTDATTVLEEDDTKTLIWNRDLIERKTSVRYSYSVPHVWPYLYALGPAEIDYDSKSFMEARPWYVAVDPSQFARPSSDVTVGLWTTAPLYASIDEVSYDDLDNITSSKNPTADICEVGLSSVTDPLNSSGHIIRYRAKTNVQSGMIVYLMQGATTIASQTPPLTTSFQTFTYTLTAVEADSITNYTDLRLRFSADGKANTNQYVSWAEFEVPGADTTPPTITIDVPTTSSPVYRKGGEQFYVNFTYTELNPKNYTVKIYNSSAVINTTGIIEYPPGGTNQIATVSFNLNSTAANGKYNVSVEMYDNSSNYNISYQNNSVVKMGYSNVTWISPPDPSEYTVGQTITLTCLVRDANTSSPIANYPVHFYNRTDSTVTHDFGLNYTNSSGYALMNWDTTGVAAGWYYPKCNITDNATLFYNVTADNEDNTSIELKYATTLEIRNQTNVTAISSINLSGTSGDTVKDPYNNVDGSDSPQNITNKIPVVTIYNPPSSTKYKIWLKVEGGTGWDDIVKDEKFNVTAEDTDPGEVSTWTSLRPGGSWGTFVDTGETIDQGTHKDLYLAFVLKGSGTGNSTISVLGEVA